MFLHAATFELRHQLRQPLLWATAVVFAAAGFLATTTDALQIAGPIGSLNRNAPFVVVRLLGHLALLGSMLVVMFVATAALRDFERRTDELVFARPVPIAPFLLGRFAGSLAAACACFLCAAAGTMAGSFMPWLDPARIGPVRPAAYLFGTTVLAFVNFAILGAIFFAVASRTRHLVGTCTGFAAVLVAFFVADAMTADLESWRGAALLDPFGLTAFDLQTRYWTIAEKNARVPELRGELLWNRALWLAVAVVSLALAVQFFRGAPKDGTRARLRALRREPLPVPVISGQDRLRVRPTFTRATPWRQLQAQVLLEARLVVFRAPFLVILALGLANMLANMGYLELMLGTPVWPVTHLMLLAISSGYSFLLILVLVLYGGESVWRARDARMDGVLDAAPVPTWTAPAAKAVALWLASGVFIAAGMLALAGYQLAHGYTNLEPRLYAQGFVVEIVPFLQVAVLALCIQAIVNQKYVGYLLMAVYVVSTGVLRAFRFDHHLYRFASTPAAPYSDMNGWGHFAPAVLWFDLYWSLAAGILFCLACLVWVRGSDTAWQPRWRVVRERLTARMRLVLAALLAAMAATGSYVFYNTNVLNEYLSFAEVEARQADFERQFSRFRELPQPKVAAVLASVDIYPSERRARLRGSYRLVNRGIVPIADLHVVLPANVTVRAIDLPSHRVARDDRRHGYTIFTLDTPLPPGADMPFGFDLELSSRGFVNGNADSSIVENGTFFHARQLPALGYQEDRELATPSARSRHGLPRRPRLPAIDDQEGRLRNDLASDADLVDFEAVVSTSADQIALAPGDLLREWREGDRRYFHYRMASPIPKFFAFLSARYAARRSSWNGIGIEVFHHPGHPFNVDRMLEAAEKTLRYMTAQFGPYQHGHVRIAEFPRYTRGAASFPSLVPFSESAGFIARLEDDNHIDYPFYVTAHEIAHQWWGYQVLPAAVQGAGMLSESMAQYAALMVMEKEYGPGQMRRFLRHELDGYLSGRGAEHVEEMPLALVENQPYIHYRKGSLALYALRDVLGEETLNGALRRYIASVRALTPPPYTVSRDLLAFVADVTPPEKRHLLQDLFETITLFDIHTSQAHSRRLQDGRYEVTLTGSVRKLRADGRGRETDVPPNDWIDVGIFEDPHGPGDRTGDHVLYFRKHHVGSPDVSLRIVVDRPPRRAGLDPYNKLIDRRPDDNVRAVEGQ